MRPKTAALGVGVGLGLGLVGGGAKAAPLRIMELGDSITEYAYSEECPMGYRYELWKDLVGSGAEFQLVGTRHFNHQLPAYHGREFEDTHQGLAGWTVGDFIRGKPSDPRGNYEGTIETMLGKSFADVVLLHLGTNDSSQHRPLADYLNDMRRLIKALQGRNAHITILLATIIPPSTLDEHDGGALIPVYNRELPQLAAEMRTAESAVELVDQTTGYQADVDNCDLPSRVHPGRSGAKKMADRWMGPLKKLLKRDDQWR